MKRLSILGSTGSIGTSTLDVVAHLDDRLEVVALGAGTNLDRLEEQIARFAPRTVAVRDAVAAAELRRRIGERCRIVHGEQGLVEVAAHDDVDMVVSGLVGALGLRPTAAALRRGRDVALANKEVLVVAGSRMTELARENEARILPVDSEHNALHQCLRGERAEEVRRLWLTASGGPFRGFSRARLEQVTPAQALRHPTWKMGPKITVDSATLMNKGLEVIEAHWLFGVEPEAIRVVVHPQSIVHSMVELVDGSLKAQLGVTDMRHPIQYALCWPDRLPSALPEFDPFTAGPLEFLEPDVECFPCLDLAFQALRNGGAAGAVLNAANEVAVEAFLAERISFMRIPELIDEALQSHAGADADTVDTLIELDRRVRRSVGSSLEQEVRS